MNAGAYAFSMASQGNSRPLPAELWCVMVKQRLVRERKLRRSIQTEHSIEALK